MNNPIPSRPADLPHGGWMEAAVRVLNERYTLKDEAGQTLETPDDVMWRVAYTIAVVDRTFGAADEHVMRTARRFYELMVLGQFMPNSPTLMNAGKPNGLQWSACYVLPIPDDLSGIFMTMHDAALIHQAAGGTGFAFSRLRSKGSRVRTTSGVSSGPVSFLRVYNAATEHVKQGASRRGANMAILRCLAGTTPIYTLSGIVPIKALVGQHPYVYACDPVSRGVHVVQAEAVVVSGRHRELVRVWMDNDTHIDCTPDHRFLLADGAYREAAALRIGDRLMAFEKSITQHGSSVRFVRTIGCTGGQREYEHRVVMRDVCGKIVTRDWNVHHDDEDSLNNDPANLVHVTRSEHAKAHNLAFAQARRAIAERRRGRSLAETYGPEKADEWRANLRAAKQRVGNHRVVRVEASGIADEVYDITVPLYHNFVAGGVFVHNCDHPDILEFVTCKRDGGIANFNISVAISDAFMRALDQGAKYQLLAQPGWPLPGGGRARGGEALGELDAREVWQTICDAAWATGDPGLFFIDRVNASPANAVPTLQTIEATNPCGEQSLPPYGACTLGHLNLAAFARDGQLDWDALAVATHDAVLFLDNVVEANPYTLPAIRKQALNERRIGLGVMGWADLLFTLGIPYASEEAVELARRLGQFVLTAARQASEALAVERGPFPWFAQSIYNDGPLRRNSNLTTVAPTGTVSIFAGCSSGIEPIFALAFQHRVRQPDGSTRVLTFLNAAVRQALAVRGVDTPGGLAALERHGTLRDISGVPEDVKALFATAHEVPVGWHVQHQAAWQTSFSESSVSKTINLPHAATVEDVARAYRLAWDTGCLGITVFRDGCKGEQVLHVGASRPAAAPAESAIAPATTLVPLVAPRPRRVKGDTWEVQSPLGEVYVTLNLTDESEPFEIFVRVGKSGTDIEAFAEALGRLMSNFLRYNRLPDRKTRLAKIVKQLSGIGGSGHVGFGANRIRSVPDAIAKALSEFLAPEEAERFGLVNGGGAKHLEAPPPVGDMCPKCGNATFVYEEGCRKCHSCLHSEC